MILQVKNVSKQFGGLQALNDVSFELSEGRILGLIGPNGAGKTTLFNTINGVFAPTQGQIVFRGEDVTGQPAYNMARRGLARAHQVVRPLSDLTVHENVMVGACFGREGLGLRQAARRAEEALSRVGLIERAEQPAGSLNVAQKKRLEMARALAAQPYLILLDEVLAGLNPSEITAMMATIRAIREQGATIFMIEHVMQAIMSISDHIIVLDYGSLIASGPPQEVANNQKVIEAYLGDPRLTERLMAE
ncbi:MAG: ABC transporter ATP-binding protein [Desulfobacteraceae bacterium]|nr:ABC transporter ATP-binding protein [Desulfobacteraceae bacterium]